VDGVEKDIALLSEGATASQSSTYQDQQQGGFPASKAIDGTVSTRSDSGPNWPFTMTNQEPDPWWMVDLTEVSQQYEITRVVVWNRMGTCLSWNCMGKCTGSNTERLSGATILVLDSAQKEIAQKSIGDATGVQTIELQLNQEGSPITTSSPHPRTCQNKGVRYVMVSLCGNNRILSLAEVKVFALVDGVEKDIALLSEGATASQSSTYQDPFPASRAIDGTVSTISDSGPNWPFTMTNQERDPWWMVDLTEVSQQYAITRVELWNRMGSDTNTNTARLSQAMVFLLDSDDKVICEKSIGDATGRQMFELHFN